MRRSAARIAFCCLATAPLLALAPTAGDVAVVYVEANVGVASAGHAALRVDGYAYDYQHGANGLPELRRQPWRVFVHDYADLGNRPLHVAHLALSAEQVESVADAFAGELMEQQELAARIDGLALDRAWLAALRERQPAPPLRATGLLAADNHGSRTIPDDHLTARLASVCGPGWLDQRRAAIKQQLGRWGWQAVQGTPLDLKRLRELLQEREALAALADARGLDPAACFDLPDQPPLSLTERRALALRSERQWEQLLGLLDSSRPDRGRALLISLARYRALERCLASGRLWLLDDFGEEARTSGRVARLEPAAGAALADQARRVFHRLRARLADADAGDERPLGALEECGTRLAELRRGLAGQPAREQSGRLVPSRARVPRELPTLPGDDGGATRRALDARAALLASQLRERGAYDLVRRNCVTELAHTLRAGLGGTASAPAPPACPGNGPRPGAGLAEQLGFIPWVFYEQVLEQLHVSSVERLPGYRERALSADPDNRRGWVSELTEATTLGSSVYRPRAADGAFLLFTDDHVWPRPLFGALNLAYSLGDSVVGLVSAPFDDGERLGAGLNGALFSLPELLFFNIRKGSFARAPEGAADPAYEPTQPRR